MIDKKICTWYTSCAVMACAKFWCNLMACNWSTTGQNFHQIQIIRKNIVEQALLLFLSNSHSSYLVVHPCFCVSLWDHRQHFVLHLSIWSDRWPLNCILNHWLQWICLWIKGGLITFLILRLNGWLIHQRCHSPVLCNWNMKTVCPALRFGQCINSTGAKTMMFLDN